MTVNDVSPIPARTWVTRSNTRVISSCPACAAGCQGLGRDMAHPSGCWKSDVLIWVTVTQLYLYIKMCRVCTYD